MDSFQGQLLVATPQLVDPNFFRTVVLILQHNDDGALGVVLNRPLEPTIQAVWEQVGSDAPCLVDGPIHKGGPCDGPLMVVHGRDEHSQIEVIPGVHFSTEKDAVEDLVARVGVPMKFFVGYSGWGAGQLEREVAEGSWMTTAATTEMVFEEDAEDLWDTARKAIARATTLQWVDPKRIPPDPTVN